MNILDKIVQHKIKEVDQRKSLFPVALLERSLYMDAPCMSLVKYINRADKVGVIAEFKRRSPSKSSINLYADIERVSLGYMMAGASALSVLTDEHFFGGSSDDLKTARKFNFCPILRKDFIIDEYQVLEARSIGADAILLIAAILSKAEIKSLSSLAHSLGLEVLFEIHSQKELNKMNDKIDIIGVNNRDLDTFTVNPDHSIRLFPQLPREITKISESGIHDIHTLMKLRTCGFNGFLIGERFMASPDPVAACQKFIEDFNKEIILSESIVGTNSRI